MGRVNYAEVAYFIVHIRLPNRQELEMFNSELVSSMRLPDQIVDSIARSPIDSHPMDILRTEVSHLGLYDPDGEVFSKETNIRRATRLIAQVPVIVATIFRTRQNQPVLSQRTSLI